jgi:hypothetical protein
LHFVLDFRIISDINFIIEKAVKKAVINDVKINTKLLL